MKIDSKLKLNLNLKLLPSWLVTLVLLMGHPENLMAVGQRHVVPFDSTLDWDVHIRTLRYRVIGGVDNCVLVAGANADPPVGDPTGGMFTLGDGARVAANLWNVAGTPWRLVEAPQAPWHITITKAVLGPFNPAMSQAPTDLLAVHTTMRNAANHITSAVITINQNVPLNAWGISNQATTWDPIILLLHEFGHCLRLNDQAGVIGPNGQGGDVMNGVLQKGVHRWNPGGADPAGFRNPGPRDICEAIESGNSRSWRDPPFGEGVPVLSGGGLVLLGFVFLTAGLVVIRRRFSVVHNVPDSTPTSD